MSISENMSRIIMIVLLGLGAGLFFVPKAQATCTALGCNCIVSADAVPFGGYDPQSASPHDAVGAIDVTCSALTLGGEVSYEISIDQGGAPGFNPRLLQGAQNDLNYNLYVDAGRTMIWGDGTGGTFTESDGYSFLTGLVINRQYTVYGRIPGSQLVPSGNYNDALTVTIVF